MKKLFFATMIACVTALFTACGDSNNATSGTDQSYDNGGVPGESVNTLKDSRDGHTYKTVVIGSQTWMAENLNYDPGDVSAMGSYAWSGCYDDDVNNCSVYGRLYTWEVAMNNASCARGSACSPAGQVQGICPDGWHLPSESEWSTLFNAVGGKDVAGNELKSTSGWLSDCTGCNGNGTYGFAVLPAGGRIEYNKFYGQGEYAYFWSSTEAEGYAIDPKYSSIGFYFDIVPSVGDASPIKYYAYSVRCLRNN